MSHNNPKTTVGAFYTLVIPNIREVSDSVSSNIDSFGGEAAAQGQDTVRRPTDGMRQLDDVYATLSVISPSSNRTSIKNTSAKSGSSTFTSNLMVQTTNYRLTEKVQTNQTFDQDRLFFFGKSLATLEVSAILIENESFQWLNEFYTNYLDYTSGTALAESGTKVELSVEGRIFKGYLTAFSFSRNPTDLHTVQINFSMTVFDTKFKRKLANTASIPTEAALTSQQGVLNRLNDTINKATNISVRIPRSSDPRSSLIDQFEYLAHVNFAETDTVTFNNRDVSLSEAYPTEFINTESGKSKDLQTAAAQANAANQFIKDKTVEDLGFKPDNIYAYDEHLRDSIAKRAFEESVAIRKAERVVTDQGERYGVKYVPATSTNTSNLSKMIGDSPITDLFILAGVAFTSAVATEAASIALSDTQTFDDFSIGRVGENALLKITKKSIASILGSL